MTEIVLNYFCNLDKRFSNVMFVNNKYPTLCQWMEWLVHGFPWLILSSLALIVSYGKGFDKTTQYAILLLNIALCMDLILIAFVKFTFLRERPTSCKGLMMEHSVDKYSFPSGHSSRAAMILVLLHNFYPTCALIISPFPLIIGLSRVALGRHFITDVLAGLLFGYLEGIMILCIPVNVNDLFRNILR